MGREQKKKEKTTKTPAPGRKRRSTRRLQYFGKKKLTSKRIGNEPFVYYY